MALIWGVFLWIFNGVSDAAAFGSGYIMEWALSMDNLMAIALVFGYFGLPKRYEPRILTIGIWSAVIFRLLFTLVGASLFAAWERPCEIAFGIVVGYTAVKLIMNEGEDHAEMVDHNSRWYIRSLRRWIPISGDASRPVFFKKEPHKPWLKDGPYQWAGTPLLACLIAVEATDVVFSFDSVPTVVAVSRTPLVIFSAMMFAVLGLRSMYHLMVVAQKYLVNLQRAVVAVLGFLVVKMLLHGLLNVDLSVLTLPVVLAILAWGVISSLREAKRGGSQEKIW
jgi:tellurite resistance protein TerC